MTGVSTKRRQSTVLSSFLQLFTRRANSSHEAAPVSRLRKRLSDTDLRSICYGSKQPGTTTDVPHAGTPSPPETSPRKVPAADPGPAGAGGRGAHSRLSAPKPHGERYRALRWCRSRAAAGVGAARYFPHRNRRSAAQAALARR